MTINTQSIRNLEKTIRKQTDCQSILFSVEMIVDQQIKLIQSVVDSNQKLKTMFEAMTKLPKSVEDLIDIFKKTLIVQAIEQLKAAIEQAVQIIEYANALSDLVSAVEDATKRLPDCFAQIPTVIEKTVKQKIDNSINELVAPALNSVKSAADVINDALPGVIQIDTTDANAFLESVKNITPINTDNIVFQYKNLFN